MSRPRCSSSVLDTLSPAALIMASCFEQHDKKDKCSRIFVLSKSPAKINICETTWKIYKSVKWLVSAKFGGTGSTSAEKLVRLKCLSETGVHIFLSC